MADAVILTKAAFARLMGVDRAQPTRWAAAGMPVLPDGKVDAFAATAWVRANIDPGQRERRTLTVEAPPGQTPNQQFMALRVLEKQRDMARVASTLLLRADLEAPLAHALVALRRGVLAMPAAIADRAGLTREQQKAARAALADELRTFVARIKADGLPADDADAPDDDD